MCAHTGTCNPFLVHPPCDERLLQRGLQHLVFPLQSGSLHHSVCSNSTQWGLQVSHCRYQSLQLEKNLRTLGKFSVQSVTNLRSWCLEVHMRRRSIHCVHSSVWSSLSLPATCTEHRLWWWLHVIYPCHPASRGLFDSHYGSFDAIERRLFAILSTCPDWNPEPVDWKPEPVDWKPECEQETYCCLSRPTRSQNRIVVSQSCCVQHVVIPISCLLVPCPISHFLKNEWPDYIKL